MPDSDGSSSLLGASLGPGLLLVLGTALVSGVSNFINLYAVAGTNSDAFVTVRNCTVALLLIPFALLATSRPNLARLRGTDWLRLVTIGVIGGGIPFLLFFHGLELAAASHRGLTASFLYRTLFLMASVLGVLVLKEHFRWQTALAAALLLLGNLLLISLAGPIWANGDLYVLAATALWAIEYMISKRTLRNLPSGTVGVARMGFGSLFLLGYLGATSQMAAVGSLSVAQWGWVGVSAILLVAFVVTWYAGLARLGLGTATSVLVLGFPITWLLSIGLSGLRPTSSELVGAVAIAVGVVIVIGRQAFRSTWDYLQRPTGPTASA